MFYIYSEEVYNISSCVPVLHGVRRIGIAALAHRRLTEGPRAAPPHSDDRANTATRAYREKTEFGYVCFESLWIEKM